MSVGFWTKDSATQSTPESQAVFQIDAILRGQRRQVEDRTGQIDALAARQRAADHDLRIDVVGAETGDAHAHAAVVDQQVMAGMTAAKISGCGSGIASLSPSVPERTKRIVSPAVSMILPSLIVPTRIFGPLQILQDADRPLHFLLQRADRGMDLGMILMDAMAEIEPERIDAGQNKVFSISGEALAGPTVATILARRCRCMVRFPWPPPGHRAARLSARLTGFDPAGEEVSRARRDCTGMKSGW